MVARGLLVLCVLLQGGCASKLIIKDSEMNDLVGVPVRLPITVTITTITTYKKDPTVKKTHPDYRRIQEACNPTRKTSIASLPLGEQIYLNVDPSSFGKSEFSITASDAGGFKSVSINSNPAESLASTSNLLGTLLPYLGRTQERSTGAARTGTSDLRQKYCFKVSESVDPASISPVSF